MEFDTSETTPRSDPFGDIPIDLTVSVGHARPLVRDLLELVDGSVLPLDRTLEDPVELYAGERLIARGELEELEGGQPGQLAIRLTEVAAPGEDLR